MKEDQKTENKKKNFFCSVNSFNIIVVYLLFLQDDHEKTVVVSDHFCDIPSINLSRRMGTKHTDDGGQSSGAGRINVQDGHLCRPPLR